MYFQWHSKTALYYIEKSLTAAATAYAALSIFPFHNKFGYKRHSRLILIIITEDPG
jgi:hypothetical protein